MRLRLRDEAAVEPLIAGWPAWLMTADPVSWPFYRRHHLDLMRSYLRAPSRHAAAIDDPRLQGGSFCDLAAVERSTVECWTTNYAQDASDDLAFARALDEFRHDHRDPPDYDALPPILQGRVEVCQGTGGRWFARPFRGASPRPTSYGVAVWLDGRHRPSMFSTPRIAGDPRVRIGYGDASQIAAVAALQHTPQPEHIAKERLRSIGVAPDDLLVEAPPGKTRPQHAHLVAHASIALPTSDGWLLSDPVPPPTTPFARQLRDVGLVLITHGHPDHLNFEALFALAEQNPTVVVPAATGGRYDPPIAPAVRAIGISEVIEVRPDDQLALGSVVLRVMPSLGEHGSLPIAAKCAYHVEVSGRGVIIAGDASGIGVATNDHATSLSGTEPLIIGMEPAGAPTRWLYGPLLLGQEGMTGTEPLAGATADDIVEIAGALGSRAIRIYGISAPWMNHVFGRSTATAPKVEHEAVSLLALAELRGLDVRLLDVPGAPLAIESA